MSVRGRGGRQWKRSIRTDNRKEMFRIDHAAAPCSSVGTGNAGGEPWEAGHTAIDEVCQRRNGTAVGGDANVLKDEGAVEEEDVVLVRVKDRGELLAGGGVGGGAEGLADVNGRARHSRITEGLSQEVDVRNLIVCDLLREHLHETYLHIHSCDCKYVHVHSQPPAVHLSLRVGLAGAGPNSWTQGYRKHMVRINFACMTSMCCGTGR